MSIISNFVASPIRVEKIVDFLKEQNQGYLKEELKQLFTPNSPALFNEVYAVSSSLGIIEEKENKTLWLNSSLQDTVLRVYIEQHIVEKVFATKDCFAFSLSWFLLQDPLHPIDWSDNVGSRVHQDLNGKFDELDLSNKERFQHFIYWANYLGLAMRVGVRDKTYVMPDPTKAIERHLVTILKNEDAMPIYTFMKRLSERLPYFEGGWIRTQVEEVAREGLVREVETLSASTSLSLVRLQERNIIILESFSDAQVIVLSGVDANRVTHIRYVGGKK